MAKDKKKKSAEQKAAKAAKQSKKAAKSDKKISKKQVVDDSDAEDVDLDAVLKQYAEQQALFLKVTESKSTGPSPRSSSTLLASPSNKNELFLFGGEYSDGNIVSFYNDLFVYKLNLGEWRSITSPNTPLPRSGHAWCNHPNSSSIFLFGGEFSSPRQGTFHHYNDFWQLDPDSREWTRIEVRRKGASPPARSGHRMVAWKNYVVLFGGFQDTSQQTRYLNDLWIYDVRENVWFEFKQPPAAQKPDPRSSFSLLPHDSGAVLVGGYSRVRVETKANKQAKGASTGSRNVLKPMVHQDSWFLRMTPPPSDAQPGTPPGMRWERRKRPANIPSPARAGATMTHHKGRGVFFGGVHDVEESEEGIESDFFSNLYIYNIDRNRMFPSALRRPKQVTNKAKRDIGPKRARGKADEEELLANLARLNANGTPIDHVDAQTESIQPESVAEDTRSYPVRFEYPHARFNAQLTVQEDTLFIYGGTFERKDIEITMSDLYAIDLVKLDGVKELMYTEPANLHATMVESESESDDEMEVDESESESEMAESDMAEVTESESWTMVDASEEEETVAAASTDPRPFPRAFESRADFFRRTTTEWQRYVLDYFRNAGQLEVKELREKAFSAAEERWWDCREEVAAMEDEMEESGMGEVVSLGERGEGSGKRR